MPHYQKGGALYRVWSNAPPPIVVQEFDDFCRSLKFLLHILHTYTAFVKSPVIIHLLQEDVIILSTVLLM